MIKPKPNQEKAVALSVMLQAVAETLDDRGRRYGWLYNVVETLRRDLATILADVISNFENRQDALDALAARHAAALNAFAQQYRQLCAKAPAPYAGCAFCASPCRYRYEIAPLAQDKTLARDFVETIRNVKNDEAMWRGLARLCREAAGRAVQGVGQPTLDGVALCFAGQMAAAQGLSSASQRKLVKNVKEAL